MDTVTLNEMVLTFLLYLQQAYAIDQTIPPPQLNFLSDGEMTQMACARECNGVRGWTPPGNSIYLHEDLSIEKDRYDQSILLHELVHYVQYQYGLDVMPTECLTWKTREAKAYQLQIQWLHEQRVSMEKYGLHRVRQRLLGDQCLPE